MKAFLPGIIVLLICNVVLASSPELSPVPQALQSQSDEIIKPKTQNLTFSPYSGEILLQESFTTPNFFPEGWFIQADVVSTNPGAGYDNWSVSNTVNAGGQAPELRFHFMPVFSAGYSRMVTLPVASGDYTDFELFFKQRLSNFTTNANEQIAIELSTDGANTWEVLWFFNISQSYGPEETTVAFNIPNPVDAIHIGFRFSGNSYNIFNWSIDDVLLRSTPQEDLMAINFTGPELVVSNQVFDWEIAVYNNGQSLQDEYTIKLIKVAEGDDIVLASTPGAAVAPGEVAATFVSWAPGPDHEGIHQIYGYIVFEGDQDTTNNASVIIPLRVLEEWAMPVTVGLGKEYPAPVGFRVPFDFYSKNNLAQVMYYPEELNHVAGYIHGLVYYSSFVSDNVENEEVKIFLGTTEAPDFQATNGFIPAIFHTLVYFGNVSIPQGESVVYVEFDTPFFYTGHNLVVTTNRVFHPGNTNFNVLDRYYSSETTQYPNRSMRVRSDATIYNPLYPPQGITGGSLSAWHPNTSFVFSGDGIGSINGVIAEQGGNPLPDAEVSVLEYPLSATSNPDGTYHLSHVPAGTVNLLVTLFGYHDDSTSVVVTEGETSIADFTLIPLQTISVSGVVTGSDFPTAGLEGAEVTLKGYAAFETLTIVSGAFLIENVFAGKSYTFRVTFEGYEDYVLPLETGNHNIDLGTIVLQEIALAPEGVRAEAINNNEAKVYWYAPGEAPYTEFRYDDGTATGQLGYAPGNLNSMLGAAWRREALIDEVSWFLTNDGGPHQTVTIRIFGLDENGHPDHTNSIIRYDNVPNQHMVWNKFTLPEPLYLPEGFFIGVSVIGFLSLGHDDGVGPPWAFKNNTMYASPNVFNTPFQPLENSGFSVNLMIRAYGIDYGWVNYDNLYTASLPAYPFNSPKSIALSEPFITGSSFHPTVNAVAFSKIPEGFRVYRLTDGEENNYQKWSKIIHFTSDTIVFDPDWDIIPAGAYRYAVQSVYTNENLSDFAFSNKVINEADGFNVTFMVDMSMAENFDPDLHEVYLSGDMSSPPWRVPGGNETFRMHPDASNPMNYAVNLNLAQGSYAYKYFLFYEGIHDPWSLGEWDGPPNRSIVVDGDVLIENIWGITYTLIAGDANCDGLVNVLDIITTVNYILGLNPEPFCFVNADTNNDGLVNVLDVIETVNIILGGAFNCGTSVVTDPRDGSTYNTALIGDQCWLAENMTFLPSVSPSSQGSYTEPHYYVYEYQGVNINEAKATANYQNYGVLYNWVASLEACPPTGGWRLPSDIDWTTLVNYLGSNTNAGGKMKSTRTSPELHPRWDSPNTGATNESNFTGFPGGTRDASGTFQGIGMNGTWWSSTSFSSSDSWIYFLSYENTSAGKTSHSKQSGFSARCIKD